ncbi:hypothetical protein KSX_42640 [Ktedonospora formicarum]|uniref:Uncharacterized protein n=1 Tax=Ktedonospora formicarum TaxID=2778364 RepID=A0A8J3HZM1_9CHLR|nr:hypothetical protein KSX_42640 [Ktedonospora formicarum]
MSNRQELIQAIELNRKVIAALGRGLAQQYGFEYPSTLEETVLQSWQNFVEAPCTVDEERIFRKE